MAKSKAAKRSGNNRVSAEEFVKAWAKGGTAHDVSVRLNLGLNSVYSRGRILRKAGVKLPKLASGRRVRIDVAALNALLGA